jgi:uncharacterized protein (DUF1501 family)
MSDPTALSRRSVLQALAFFGASTPLLGRALAAEPTRAKTLVLLFLRGGVDGLAFLPPVGDSSLASLRPTLAVKGPSLDGFFSLHPSLAPLEPLYRAKRLAALHAVGQARPSRSHFDAQDFLESGLDGKKSADGFLSRALEAQPSPDGGAFRAVALQNALPHSLAGDAGALAFPSLKAFRVAGGVPAATTFEALYAGAVDEALKGSGHDAFDGLSRLRETGLADAPPRNGAAYPTSPLGRRLSDIARVVHGGVGLRVAATETGGFDTHLAQGAEKGALANRLDDLAKSLVAFATDLGPKLDDVVLVTVTEFGRTAKENGTHGTDHGTASAMLVLGGGVKGGRVVSDWPGLSSEKLFEQRDVAATTDVRAVLAEALAASDLPSKVFPDFTPKKLGLF